MGAFIGKYKSTTSVKRDVALIEQLVYVRRQREAIIWVKTLFCCIARAPWLYVASAQKGRTRYPCYWARALKPYNFIAKLKLPNTLINRAFNLSNLTPQCLRSASEI